MDPSVAMFLSFLIVSVFSFLSVAVWAATRERERKEFYRGEMLKKLAESGPTAVTEYLREEERIAVQHRAYAQTRMHEGNRLGGAILIAVGIGLMYALRMLVNDLPIHLFGLIPLGIGIALLVSSFVKSRGGPPVQ